jgi:non-homologous end joining protein Ku
MPRASWRGFVRFSLVSCPIYLSPATTRTKPIRLHQVATKRRPMWTRTSCRMGAEGQSVLRDRYRGS